MATDARPMRADAVRNRAKILDAARSQLAAHGPEVGMDEIAASAGVAVGTLYRHFPTKTDLVAAVLGEFVAQVTTAAEDTLARVERGAAPLGALLAFVREVLRIWAQNAAAKSAAPALGVSTDHDETQVGAAVGEVIRRGILGGDVRADLTVDDVYVLMLTAPLDQPAPVLERWADLVLPCLTAAVARVDLAALVHEG